MIHKKNIKYLSAIIALSLCLVFLIHQAAYAAPISWDVYQDAGGIDTTIYNTENTTMNTYNDSYTLLPGDGEQPPFGSGNSYTDLTINTSNKTMSKWYISGYGPLLDYATNHISTAENDSLNWNSQINTYANSNYAYIGSNQNDLSELKSVAIMNYTSDTMLPVIVNSNPSTLDSAVTTELDNHNINNLVVLGGSQVITDMFAIGGKYNIIRVGGTDRNDTFNLLSDVENNDKLEIYNPTKPNLQPDSYGAICDLEDTYNLKLKDQNIILGYLDSGDFNSAATYLLQKSQGSRTNIDNGQFSYSSLIGCNGQYLKVYYINYINGFSYGIYQYIGPQYFSTPVTPPPPPPVINNVTANISAPNLAVVGVPFSVISSGSAKDPNGNNSISFMSSQLYFDNIRTDNDTGQIYTDANMYVPHSFATQKDSYDTSKSSATINKSDTVTINKEGTYYAYNCISSDGGTAYAPTDYTQPYNSHQAIKVTYPTPIINLTNTGIQKEQHKIVLDLSSSTSGSPICQIDWSKTQWSIHAVSGGSNSDSDMRIQTHAGFKGNGTSIDDGTNLNQNLLNQQETIDTTFMKAGQYIITATIYNNYTANSKFPQGVPATATITLNIVPRQKPQVGINVTQRSYRQSNGYGTLTATMASVTCDSDDVIDNMLWTKAFDANNNGTTSDDTWYAHDNTSTDPNAWIQYGTFNQILQLVSDLSSYSPKNTSVNTVTDVSNHMGAVKFILIVDATFAQNDDYIPQFVNPTETNSSLQIN